MNSIALAFVIITFAVLDFLAEKWGMPNAEGWSEADSIVFVLCGGTLIYVTLKGAWKKDAT